MIISLITGNSIYQKGLALGILGDAKATSKTHRIYINDNKRDKVYCGTQILNILEEPTKIRTDAYFIV